MHIQPVNGIYLAIYKRDHVLGDGSTIALTYYRRAEFVCQGVDPVEPRWQLCVLDNDGFLVPARSLPGFIEVLDTFADSYRKEAAGPLVIK